MEVREFYRLLIKKQIPIIVDSSELNKYFGNKGYQTILFDNYDFTSQQVALAIISDYEYYARLLALSDRSETTLVQLAAVRYDRSLEAIVYSFDRLLSYDIERGLELRDKSYEKIANSEEELYLTDERGSKLQCWLSENLEVVNSEHILEAGWFYSFAEFGQASIVNIKGNKSSFSVEGRFFFDGIIHGATIIETKNRNEEALNYLLEIVASGREKYIEVENNSINRLIIDGKDETNLLLELELDPERKLSITEMGFGCNKMLRENVNWQVNSQINQVIHGMHLAIGTAYNCPYVDFISQTIEIV
jgi:hypothetical protein